MREPVEVLEFPDGVSVQIFQDDQCESPRENDNLGTMVCDLPRYSLGDKHSFSVEQIKAMVKRKDVVSLPIFAYIHGGITIKTTPFSCPWDSGQAGYIFITKEKIRQEYGWKLVTKKRREKILSYLQSEVDEYDRFLCGDCCGYKVFKNGEETDDSCWGFIGLEYLKEELKSQYGISERGIEVLD